MSIVIAGATGQLGVLVLEHLLRLGPGDTELVGLGRETSRLDRFAADGVRIAAADYDQPGSLKAPLAGAETVLLISGSAIGRRVGQHRAVIDAAVAAGAKRVVYTSVLHADTSPLALAADHVATEKLIAEAGVDFAFLRNGWYTENYVETVRGAAQTGEIKGSAGTGRVASATRSDFAEAAARVLLNPLAGGKTYELAGDAGWTFTDLAAAASDLLHRPVAYRGLTTAEHRADLTAAGLDAGTVEFLVALDANIRDGALDDGSGDLSRLLGRPTTGLKAGLG
ncbi:MAG: SDR family oxidoreductase, partial [Bifidobacteriaceae bacterium]|nr:SDR family oxidoreductase [Bifidobacteriaceae bacterium]